MLVTPVHFIPPVRQEKRWQNRSFAQMVQGFSKQASNIGVMPQNGLAYSDR